MAGCGATERRALANHSYAGGLLFRRNVEANEYYVRKFTGGGGAVNIPNNHNGVPITKIESGAFAGTGITSVTLPNTLRVIGASAFHNLLYMTEITIPASVEYIGARAFCNNINTGNWNQRVSNLSNVTFEGASSLAVIGNSAFANTSIRTIVIPRSVEHIGASAFSTSSNAERGSSFASIEFEIGSNLTTIGSGAFTGTSITSIVFPSKLESIPSFLFNNVTTLTNVKFESGGKNIASIGSGAFANTRISSIIIPANVERIYGNAFRNIRTLTTVHIPDGITRIAQGAFANNPALVNLTFDNSEAYRLVGNTVIRNSDDTAIVGTRKSVLSSCVTNIASETFSGMGLVGVISIPNSIVNIGWGAFANNQGITDFVIEDGSNLEVIGDNAFAGNANLSNINLENATELISIGSRAFHNTRDITVLNIPSSVWLVSPWAFEGWTSSQIINVLGAVNTLEATIRLGVNWMAGSNANVEYIL